MSDPKRKQIAETLAAQSAPPKGLFGFVKPMSDQERTLREQIANGGQNLGLNFRDPTSGIMNADPFEMATGMPLTDGNEDYDALTRTALAGAAGMATPRYLQDGYEGPQTGLGPVGDFAAGLGQVFQGGSGAGSMGAPALAVSQFAGDIPDAGRALGTMGGTKVPRGLGNKLSDLRPAADAARTEDVFNRQFPGEAPDPGITAYHGSPHTFDKFDMGKIGTGEGAQAYGHGLYFAEGENVAKKYRDDLTSMRTNAAQMELDRAGGSLDEAIATTRARIDSLRSLPNGGGDPARQARQIAIQEEKLAEFNALKSGGRGVDENGKIINPGSMYQVRLAVKPDELLDWDKPLSEQPESVRGALQDVAKSYYADKNMKYAHPVAKALLEGNAETEHGALSGHDGYRYAGHAGQQPEISSKLKAAGIKGIRYKDAGSRAGEGGTYNYVIFDDSLVTILKRYGIPMTVGAGGAVVVSGANMPPDIAAQLGPQS